MHPIVIIILAYFILELFSKFFKAPLSEEFKNFIKKDNLKVTVQVCFFCPIAEELLYRGIPLLAMSFSKVLAYSLFLIFGFIFIFSHKNNYKSAFIKVVPSFILHAFLYAYMAIVYGLVWAIFTHCLYNCIALFQKRKEIRGK